MSTKAVWFAPKSWLEMTFRHVGSTFRCVPIQRRELFCFASVYKVEQASDGSHLPGSATRSAAGCAPLYTLAAGDELWVTQRGRQQLQGFCSSCQALFLYQRLLFSFLFFFFSGLAFSRPYSFHAETEGMYSVLYLQTPWSSCAYCTFPSVYRERWREIFCVYKSAKERCSADLMNPFSSLFSRLVRSAETNIPHSHSLSGHWLSCFFWFCFFLLPFFSVRPPDQ